MAKAYQNFLKKNIDLTPLRIEKRSENIPYFCTPKDANIIGWAGVDGIHFCFIRGFGEMVFSVSPMNSAPHFVHPLAKDFTDFLRLLLACGDSAALEQAWQWDEAQFDAYLKENRPTEEQETVLAVITEQMKLAPIQNPWQYITQLQAEFDHSKIPYTEDYYDPHMNQDAPQEPPAWEVYFEGNFWGHSGKQHPGKEITLDTSFDWAGHHWVIPAAYSCSKGIVIDFCMRVEPDDIRSFMGKWDLSIENELHKQFTREEQMQLDMDNPLSLDFHSILRLNGKELQSTHGCGTAYNPCLPEGYILETEAKTVLDHYRLDPNFGWVIFRSSYPWATKRKPKIKSLSLTMMQQKMPIPGPHFRVRAPDDTFSFCYQGTDYMLRVHKYQAQTLDISRMAQPGMEYPTHHHAMSYTLMPELPDGVMTIADCADGDRPRQRQMNPNGPASINIAAAIGIIGGADGPTAIVYGQSKNHGKLRAACSSLHFEPVVDVEWRIVFHEKQFEDMTVDAKLPETKI